MIIKRINGLGFCSLSLFLLLASCESKSNLTLGSSFVESSTSIVCIDTLAVNTSTLLLDSLETSNKSIALVGGFTNDMIGSINSRSYIILKNTASTIDEEAVYDSLILKLTPSGYFYGDTSASFSLNVNRVIQDIEFADYDTSLYNKSHFDFDPISLGEKTFSPKPNYKEEIRIPIRNQLGLDLVKKLKESTTAFEEDGGFANYFKGIVLSSSSNQLILGFSVDTSIVLCLYYHISDSDVAKRFTFSPTLKNLQFNQITSDRSNTLIKDISITPTSSLLLDNYSFVQGGIGLITRIEFPTIKNLLAQEKKFEIIKAELLVAPSPLMGIEFLPENLNLYITNKHNDIVGVVTDNDGFSLDGSLNIDYINQENTSYSWNITSFIREISNSIESDYDGLLLLPEKYDSRVYHIIVSDQKRSHFKTHLKLYLIYYE